MVHFGLPAREVAIRQQGIAAPVTLPAPFGGWNTRDARPLIGPVDALRLDNFYPDTQQIDKRTGSLTSRQGHSSYATGLGNNVETLAEYFSGTTRKFLAAASSNIYDVTSAGAVGAALKSGLTNARWQVQLFGTSQFWVNGADTPQVFDGSAFSNTTFTGSGLTVTDLIGVKAFKSRLYFIEKDTSSFWYGGVDAVSGTLTEFDLSFIQKHGGTLETIATLTRDGGAGADDFIAFIMTSGEVLVYQGSDPGNATDWALVGSYKIGVPLGRRSAIELAGDVVVMTTSGFDLLLEEIAKAEAATAPKSKASGAATDAARQYQSNYGWQPIHYPRRNMVLFNVPITTNSSYHQYVVNTISRSPARFTGWDARCFGIYNDRLYFGGNGTVFLADDGLDDNGSSIPVDVQWGFSNLGSPLLKQIDEVMPILEADGTVSISASLAFDYGDALSSQTTTSASAGTPWGSPWGSPWSPEEKTRRDPLMGEGEGITVSLRLQSSLQGQQLTLHGVTYTFEPLRDI